MKKSAYRSSAQWTKLIAEYNAGTESEREFCERYDMKLSLLRKWRYRFKSQSKQHVKKEKPAFAKVNVTTTLRIKMDRDAAVLHIGSDFRLKCPASFDISALAQFALEVHRGC